MVSVQYGLNELTGPSRFALHPPFGTGRHVTLDAFHASVGRILVCSEFGMHAVASGTAELWSLHVLDGAIGDLRADKDICKRGDSEKPSQAV
jgi:hypothetical protein